MYVRCAAAGLAFVLLVLLSCSTPDPDAASPAQPTGSGASYGNDEILWDEWGVPHIYGSTDEAVFRGIGWSQAQAHGEVLLRSYGRARGRAAEYWGAEYLDSDRRLRRVGLPERAAEWVRTQPDRFAPLLAAYVDGVNAYLSDHPESVSDEARRVLPVTAQDVAALTLWTWHYGYLGILPAQVRQAERALEEDGSEQSSSHGPVPGSASNAWAIGPRRSATGNAMLLANPHTPLPPSQPGRRRTDAAFTWFEIHVTGPDWTATGGTVVGAPVIIVGFNDRLGWTHTVNWLDGADLYRVEREGESYRFGDEMRPFARRQESIRVRTEDGSMRTEVLTVRETVHGPVLAADDDAAIALRVAGLDESGTMDQWWGMTRAGNLEEFEAELGRLQVPMFNVVYADADGRIMFLYNGRVPARESGDVESWAGVMDGSDPATLWTDVLPYEALPRVVDPPTGWLQNTNDPPWTATLPRALDRNDYPPYLAPSGMGMRPQWSARTLLADSSITFEELERYKHSTRMLLADRVLDDLLPLAAASDRPAVRSAGEALEAWDRAAESESRGGLLFLRWVRKWLGQDESLSFDLSTDPPVFAEPWDPDRPVSSPDGLADPEAALDALAAAAESMVADYGSLTVPWGQVHRLRFGDVDLPGNGAVGHAGVFRFVAHRPEEDGTYTAAHGDAYIAAVEFTQEGPRARGLLTYGNWSQLGSPHVGDQTRLFARKELRPLLWTRAEVEAETIRREQIPAPGSYPAPDDPAG